MSEYGELQHEREQHSVVLEARYRRQVARAYGYLPLRAYPEHDPQMDSTVPLERIFIKLSTTTRRAPGPDVPLAGRIRELEQLEEQLLIVPLLSPHRPPK